MKDISKLTTLKETDLYYRDFTIKNGIVKDADKNSFHVTFIESGKKLVFYKKNSAIFSPKENEVATCYFPDQPNNSFPIAIIQRKLITYLEKEKYKELKQQKEEARRGLEPNHYMPKFKF